MSLLRSACRDGRHGSLFEAALGRPPGHARLDAAEIGVAFDRLTEWIASGEPAKTGDITQAA